MRAHGYANFKHGKHLLELFRILLILRYFIFLYDDSAFLIFLPLKIHQDYLKKIYCTQIC